MSADLPKPVEIDWPEYNAQAMGCGLEDRCITNRYEAMEYGWNEAIDRARERVPEEPFTETQLHEYAEAKCAELRTVMAQMAEALERAECWVTGPFAAQNLRAALSAHQSISEQSARESRP